MHELVPSSKEFRVYKKRYVSMEKAAQSARMQVFAALFFRLETSGQIMDVTLRQWRSFMRKQWRWMGNVVMGDERTPVYSYLSLTEYHLKIMLHSIYGTQQIRSQSLASIKRSDISRNKKE